MASLSHDTGRRPTRIAVQDLLNSKSSPSCYSPPVNSYSRPSDCWTHSPGSNQQAELPTYYSTTAMPAPTAPMHSPRAPRPSYSEEQKFYIMFCRIVRDEKWEDIEARFARVFGRPRSRGGLTSVYYRIRKEWNMREVLKSGPAFYPDDVKGVQARANRFSRDFLQNIGYLAS